MSISSLMGASRVALSAYQSAIETTARNISNVGNTDYVRRRTDVGALISPNGGLGFREQDHIDRLESGFIQRQLWNKNQHLGRHEADELIYSQIESVFNEPGSSGLSSMMSEFWNSWNDLANDPESNTARAMVKDKGILLSNTFVRLDSDLNNMQKEIGYDLEDTIKEINVLMNQIQSINEKVSTNYSYDLADARDAAISRLSQLINIDVTERSDHIVSISTSGNISVPLVNTSSINELNATIEAHAKYNTTNVSFSEGGSISSITGGKLGSLLEIYNSSIPDYSNEIDALATAIGTEVNDVHQLGYNLENGTGISFFDPEVSGASSLSVSTAIIYDPHLIATSSNPDESGNASIASRIADLQNVNLLRGEKFSDHYNSIVSKVGSKVQESSFLKDSQGIVIDSLKNRRDSISGVSLDEEMSNLVKYQQAYQAASRMISVADELIQSVMALI